MDVAEFFKCVGVVTTILVADVFVCTMYVLFLGADDDTMWAVPLILNVIGFVVVTAVLICERI